MIIFIWSVFMLIIYSGSNGLSCEARPGLSGAHFLWLEKLGKK